MEMLPEIQNMSTSGQTKRLTDGIRVVWNWYTKFWNKADQEIFISENL